MNTNLLKTFFVALFLITATRASAHDFEVDGIYYNITDETNQTVEVTYKGGSYSEYDNEYTGSVVIPSMVTYNNAAYSVTSIRSSAFEDCDGLTSIAIPNSVTSIGNYAFDDCTGLKEVHISDLAAWCKIDFASCSNPLFYAGNLYLNGKKVTNLVIPDGVTEIKDDAFEDCRGLTRVTIPNSVTSIGESAFAYCSGLSGELTIPNSVTSIGERAFAYCSGLSGELTIPNSVTSIRYEAFFNCSGLISITIPNSVTSIGNSAFDWCTGLTGELTIPNSVTSIGNRAFYNCSGLSGELTIPNSVTSIGERAFGWCTGLTGELTIPNSVTSIGSSAFSGCSGLTGVTIPNSVTSIGDGAFADCDLTSVTIPNSVTSIGDRAFADCDLRSIHIPASLVEIGDYAFTGNLNLSSITVDKNNPVYYVPDGYKNIIMERATNKIVFACKGAVIPETATAIGNGAFNGGGIESITIPAGITSIGHWAFDDCRDLKVIYALSETPLELPYYVFSSDVKSTITLYVPIGAKEAYATAWGFDNIVETDFTGVDGVTADEQTGGNELYYDLSGRAVKNPANGIYIYKGKKVLVQ